MITIHGPEPGDTTPLRSVSDLAGIPVVDVDERGAGEVFGSLAEAKSGLIRYLDVSVDPGDRHVLVPIGHTRVERGSGNARVRLRAAALEDLGEIPTYRSEACDIDEPYQDALLAAHGQLFYGERYYAHPAFDHSGLYAGEHLIVSETETIEAGKDVAAAEDEDRLPLTGLSHLPGFKVMRSEPDIRGWTIDSKDGKSMGTVRDLMIDREAAKIRYLLVERESTGTLTLLPVGFAHIEREIETVNTPALTAEDLGELPDFDPDAPFTRKIEKSIRNTLDERLTGARRFSRPDFSNAAARKS